MTVINTSPAIHLHAVLPGGLGSLPPLIGEVIIPREVGDELACGQPKDNICQEIQSFTGLLLRPSMIAIHPLLATQLDRGEAAVIQTALDEKHGTVILDDLKARRIATMLGLKVTGTLGILLLAKQAGLLPSIRAAVTALERRGMWLAPAIVEKTIHVAGE